MAFPIKKVLISEPVDKSCETILKAAGVEVTTKVGLTKRELLEEIQGYDALVVRSATQVTADVIEAGKELRVIGRAGVGVDNIDCAVATQRGILVINAPGGNTLSAAELTCGMIVSLSRNIPGACASLKSGKWDRKGFSGTELLNKTLAIIGLGRIGREVAHRMQAFGMTTIGFDPLVPADVSIEFGVQSYDLESLWPLADYITVHTPLIPQTRNLINDEVLKKCKKGVKLINVARGGIIDEDAVVRALESGQCGGIGFDVFLEEPPKNTALIQHPKTICTPHLGASTAEAQMRVAEEIGIQFTDLMNGRFVPGVVNSPAFSHSLADGTRNWVSLCQYLGAIVGALILQSEDKKRLSVVIHGEDPNAKENVLKIAALVGCLKQWGREEVNFINAPLFAKEANIDEIKITTDQHAGDAAHKTSVMVQLESQGGNYNVMGTLNGEDSHVVALNSVGFNTLPILTKNTILCRGKHGTNMTVDLLGTLAQLGPVSSAYWSSQFDGESWCIVNGMEDFEKMPEALEEHLNFWAQLKL